MSLGKQIKFYRKKIHMTQAQLAEKVGVSFQAVSSWEHDEYAPDAAKLSGIAKTLRTTSGRLLEEIRLPENDLRIRLFDEEQMAETVAREASNRGLTETLKALPYASEKHSGQFRKGDQGKLPYINHPLTMATEAMRLGLFDDALIATILLHDVVEDCKVPYEEIPVGEEALALLKLVTKEYTSKEKAEKEPLYYAGIMTNPKACLIKCIDRENNLSNMAMGFTRNRAARYVEETERYVLPLLEVVKGVPEYENAAWVIEYHIMSLLETFKRLL